MMIADDGDTIGSFEPLMVSEGAPDRVCLNDLALELAEKSAAFSCSVPDSIVGDLASLLRTMNCYYSNLIEGHNTHPIDIERAINNDYSSGQNARNLQEEAKAHIIVQEWIDEGGMTELPIAPSSIIELHRRFYDTLPAELCFVTNPKTRAKVRVVPGRLREEYVQVGQHKPISPGAVPRFLERMHRAYNLSGRIDRILAAACAHHRLLWVHPFLDGNGRVTRLVSHAMLLQALDMRGLWSVARGLARQETEYKSRLASCDNGRRNDLDGRGTLSEEALVSFVRFFLNTCIDQVTFMESLMQPNQLRDRILIWTEEETRAGALPAKSGRVLEAVLHTGQIERDQVRVILGDSDRTARRVTSALLQSGALSSASIRAPLKLAFPAKHAGRWMPGLFPEKNDNYP